MQEDIIKRITLLLSHEQHIQSKPFKKGFTLIELIVVMAVIVVLVLLAAPKFLNYTARARETHIRNDIKVLESKIDEYIIKHDSLPTEWGGAIPGDGQLYDRTGPIDLLPPGDFKVVDKAFYPESTLPGNFYTDEKGDVIYEDEGESSEGTGDSGEGENQSPIACVNIDYSQFVETPAEYFTFDAETQTITDYSSEGPTDVVIPSEIDDVPVLKIGEYALSGYDLTSLVLSPNLIEIEMGAFDSNKIEGEVRMPCSLRIIGEYAFAYNYTIDSIVLNEGLVEIGDYAFSYNEIEGKLAIPESVTTVGAEAFYSNEITEITLPRSMTSIPAAFGENLLSKEHVMEILSNPQFSSIESANYGAFSNMNVDKIDWDSSITGELVIPDNITHIGDGAFRGSGITSLKIHDGVRHIGSSAFSLGEIESLELSKEIEYIGDHAFYENKIPGVLALPSSLAYLGEGAFMGNLLTDVTIPNTIETIKRQTFRDNKISTLKLGDNTKRIEEYAFAYNLIEMINIPLSIEFIGQYAYLQNDYIISDYEGERATKSIIIKGVEYIDKLNNSGDIINENGEIQKVVDGVTLEPMIFDSEFRPLPDGYEWATDDDFSFKAVSGTGQRLNGQEVIFQYIGTKKLVAIPRVIHGVPVKVLTSMFLDTDGVEGVYVHNKSVSNAELMFKYATGTTLDLTYFNISSARKLQDMFFDTQYTSINLSSVKFSDYSLDMEKMFAHTTAKIIDLSNAKIHYSSTATCTFYGSDVKTVYVKDATAQTKLLSSSCKPEGIEILIKD